MSKQELSGESEGESEIHPDDIQTDQPKQELSGESAESEIHPDPDDIQTDEPQPPAQIVICGAGIVGLVLALSLHKHAPGVKVELYEQADEFQDGVGAAMGMYPNGLRVIRDISPSLLDAIREAGYPYEYRRWMRHDGTEIAVASERALVRRDDDLHSLGIRRWRLQKILYDSVVEAGIPVHFSKRTVGVEIRPDELVEITFADGTSRLSQVLLGADGARSKVREFVAEATHSPSKLRYTGTTCLFGLASWPRPERGICLPSSTTTQCHGCFFPISADEQCFQFHFPLGAEELDEARWGVLDKRQGQEECLRLAERLRDDGWDSEFLEPLRNVGHVVRFGFSLLEPRLTNFVHGPVVLLGDAAHPPVPYLGQGAQMGLEDAGTLAHLVHRMCITTSDDGGSSVDLTNFHLATRAYETMRIRRTNLILKNSQVAGRQQQRRATSRSYNLVRESEIRLQVRAHGTLPLYLPGVTYDYREDVEQVLLQQKIGRDPSHFRFGRAPNSQTMNMLAEFSSSSSKTHTLVTPDYKRTDLSHCLSKISERSAESCSKGEAGEDRRSLKSHKLKIVRAIARVSLPALPPAMSLRKRQGKGTAA